MKPANPCPRGSRTGHAFATRGSIAMAITFGLPMALGLAACTKSAPPAAPAPPVVTVMEAHLSKAARSKTFIGQLDSPQNVEVRARVESFVEKILFKEGTEIKEGDPLFELNKQPYEEKLASAKAMLAEATAAFSRSKLEVERLKPLAGTGAVPQRDLDTALASRDVQQANVDNAAAKVKSAELDLGYCDIRAPLSGRIGARQVPVGSLVGKGDPTLLVTISQIDPIWFYCSISEVDFLQAERQAKEVGRQLGELPITLILADGTEHPDVGKWVFLDRVVDATTGTIRARAEFPDPGKTLRPGMFARIRISLPPGEGNILVPDRALVELQGKYFLWVIDAEGKAGQRLVEVAPMRVGSDAVILKGVVPGEKIVVEGVHKLRQGIPVQAQPLAAAKPDAAAAPSPTGKE